MRGERRVAVLPIEAVASIADQLATLLEAGVSPRSAWVYVAEVSDEPVIGSLDREVNNGASLVGALERAAGRAPDATSRPWRALAASWWVATESGASLAPCLRSLAVAFRQQGETERDIAVALAGPAATAKMVMGLPIVGLLFGGLLGFDTIGALLGTPIGWALLAAGGALTAVGAWWTGRLVKAARPRDRSPGVELDLLAVALAGGVAVPIALRIVADARTRFLDSGAEPAPDPRADRALALSVRAGVPAGGLLRSEADHARRDSRTSGQAAAASLAVRLMMPLGVCVLPAFLVLGVAPLVLVVVSTTVAGF